MKIFKCFINRNVEKVLRRKVEREFKRENVNERKTRYFVITAQLINFKEMRSSIVPALNFSLACVIHIY